MTKTTVEALDEMQALVDAGGELGRDEVTALIAELRDYVEGPTFRSVVHECCEEVQYLRSVVAHGIEAFRLTKEYVNIPDERGNVLLPDIEGWEHYDWTRRAQAALRGQ